MDATTEIDQLKSGVYLPLHGLPRVNRDHLNNYNSDSRRSSSGAGDPSGDPEIVKCIFIYLLAGDAVTGNSWLSASGYTILYYLPA
jgi:hypothetical protein